MTEAKEKKVVKPYNRESSSKKEEVAEMFDNISKRYDFLNHLLSMGIDRIWRRKAVRLLKDKNPKVILDLATGTGDFAVALLKLNPEKVVGVDISNGMLEVGKKKMKHKGVDNIIELKYGDSEQLDFEDGTFDALTVGFGVRNYQDLEKGLGEMLRVLAPGGKAAILELTHPKRFPLKQLYGFYSRRILPFFGKKISKDKRAYEYLPESVAAFPEGEQFMDIMRRIGYKDVKAKLVSGGIATIYTGIK